MFKRILKPFLWVSRQFTDDLKQVKEEIKAQKELKQAHINEAVQDIVTSSFDESHEKFSEHYSTSFDPDEFKDDLLKVSFEYDIYFISNEAIHALLISQKDVSKLLENNELNVKALSNHLYDSYTENARQGMYDDYNHAQYVKNIENEREWEKFEETPEIVSGPPEEEIRIKPTRKKLGYRALNLDKNLKDALEYYKNSAVIDPQTLRHFNLTADKNRVLSQPMTQVSFFKDFLEVSLELGQVPDIYKETGLVEEDAEQGWILNDEIFYP